MTLFLNLVVMQIEKINQSINQSKLNQQLFLSCLDLQWLGLEHPGQSFSSGVQSDGDKYIMIQCLFVTFLFIPAPPPAQSCYVWIKPKVESRK